jgi:hypothetical protein
MFGNAPNFGASKYTDTMHLTNCNNAEIAFMLWLFQTPQSHTKSPLSGRRQISGYQKKKALTCDSPDELPYYDQSDHARLNE